MNKFKVVVFGVLGAAILTMGLFSCSDEEMINSHQEELITVNLKADSSPLPPVETEVDSMFYEYVTSDIFIEIKGLISGFNEDLNFDDTPDEIDTSEKLFVWISNNIDKTNFVSVDEAEIRWNNLAVLREYEINLFPNIYIFFENASEEEFVEAIGKWFPNQNITTSNNCEQELKSCNDKANKDYKEYMDWALSHEGFERQKEINCADNQHIEDTKVCKQAFDICMGG